MSDILLTMSDNYVKMSDNYMREITFREFLRSPLSFLPPPKEGIKVVRRKGEDFYIYPDVRQTSDKSITPPIRDNYGFCEMHFDAQKRKFNRTLVSVEDANGNMIISSKNVCDMCLEKIKENIKDYGGKIYYK